MPRGGRRPNSGRKPVPSDRKVVTRSVTLSPERRALVDGALEELETFNEFCHEALDVLPRHRKAVAEIEAQIARAKHVESVVPQTGQAVTAATQRRTLEFVLGLLKPPRAARRAAERE